MLLGGIVAPVLWTGLLYTVLGIVNPFLQQRIDWFSFAVSQIIFGLVAGYTVARLGNLRNCLLLSTPAHGPLTLLAAALSSRAFERRFDPRSDHVRFYSRRTLTRLLRDFGFEQIDCRGAGGVPGARRVLLASAVRSRF